jgi:hypothetical protein
VEEQVIRVEDSIARLDDRARAIREAKQHMTAAEQQAFDRLLSAFPGTAVHTFIPVVRSR